MLVAARKMTLKNAECLPALDFQWLVQKGYYCFVEAAAPIDPLAMDGSKSCLYSFTQQASEVRTKWCFKCSSVSLLWLWCEIIVCPEHAGDLLALMGCWSSWAGRFLQNKMNPYYPKALPWVELQQSLCRILNVNWERVQLSGTKQFHTIIH